MTALKDVIRGKGVHLDPLACIEDLTHDQAGQRVLHLRHSIWQLTGHLNFWMDYGLKWIEGGTATWPTHAAMTWPAKDAPADDPAWKHEIAFFQTNLDQLATLADARASTLTRIVDRPTGKTVEAVLIELATHNSYHCGQIVQVRQVMSLWPPLKGSFTW